MAMFGFLCVNKPAGPTSHDVVARVRRRLGRGTKVGHAGTLDPFAEGVLVLCVGAATRLAGYVQAQTKRYRAVVRLGATSSTDDPEGEITPTPNAPTPDEPAVREAVRQFVGTIRQVPPSHSAVHVEGRRAYKLARAGRAIELPPRTVVVHSIDVLGWDYPRLEIDVRCGSGTYIRALARDVGEAVGTGGYCEALTRTAVGAFGLERAASLEAIDADPAGHLLSPLLAVEHLPKVTVSPEQMADLRHGRRVDFNEHARPGDVAMLDTQGRLVALGAIATNAKSLRPTKVFVTRP